jgi:hypothetical protein
MPSIPHTLIGLGPFANLGCQILFTKTVVFVIHPDGHFILEGWREQDAPPCGATHSKPTGQVCLQHCYLTNMRNQTHVEVLLTFCRLHLYPNPMPIFGPPA